jgi:hypothetical protein
MLARKAALVAVFLVLAAGFAGAAPALVTSDLNVRSGPGTNYGVVGKLPGGSTVDAVDCDEIGWCRVGNGFVNLGFLDFGDGTAGQGPVAPPPVYVAPPQVYVAPPVYVPPPYYGYRRYDYDRPGRWRY